MTTSSCILKTETVTVSESTACGITVHSISSWTNILLSPDQDCERLGHPSFVEGHYTFPTTDAFLSLTRLWKNIPAMAQFQKYPFHTPSRVIPHCT